MTEVVVLVDPAADAALVARELEASRSDAGSRVLLAPAELLGARFVADPDARAWWESQRLTGGVVVVCRHLPELVSQLAPDLLATWVLWCRNEREAALCADHGQLGLVAADAGAFAAAVLTRVLAPLGTFRRLPVPATWGPFARRPPEAAPWSPADAAAAPTEQEPPPPPAPSYGLGSVEPSPGSVETLPPIRWPELSGAATPRPLWAGPAAAPPAPPARNGDAARLPSSAAALAPARPPLAALSRERTEARGSGPGDAAVDRRPAAGGGLVAWVGTLLRRDGAGVAERLGALGARVEARHSLTLGMATSKGGVLKTTHTAGLGLVGDRALAPRGGAVAVVEANPDNADLALDLALPADAPTVRELIACLESGREVPRPHVVAGTRLEVWPEARQSAGHGSTQIARLHAHLAATYPLVIADFNNCLPDAGGGPAPELLHAWARWVDVWVVPADCSQKALVAAAESIEALTACTRAGASTPAFVLPLLVNDPGARRDRRHRELVDEFRSRGIAVVEVPHVPRVGRAAMNQWRLTEVHTGLTRAWVTLLEEAVAAAEERLPW